MDVLVLISNCPQLNNPCNAYNPTPDSGHDLGQRMNACSHRRDDPPRNPPCRDDLAQRPGESAQCSRKF